MNIDDIKSLVEIMGEGGLTCMEVTEGENKIRLEKRPAAVTEVHTVAATAVETPAALPQAAAAPNAAAAKPVDFNNLKEVKSPMVGMFYDSPSPEADSYVKIGSKVKKGDILCVIEAMKLLNEITADTDGEIVDICASNGQIVEYGQILFKIF
ncbi:MAG TPA: acetyl-CoA carboxylase biotin carboxyl carrier protein [Oscillospiraceae bacterium]|nr:acetyl-CoA carboxylase biotin carboxyl carrier protein [Oscillospiraceae bacterium]